MRTNDVRGVLRRQGVQAREALQTLLVDRLDWSFVLVAGEPGYAFTGHTFGGLLAASTWPTTFGGRVYGPPRASCFASRSWKMLTQQGAPRDSHSEGTSKSFSVSGHSVWRGAR